MSVKIKLITLSLVTGLFFWFVESEIHHSIYLMGTLSDTLIFNVPMSDFIIRSWMISGYVVFGIIAVHYLTRYESAKKQAELADIELHKAVNRRFINKLVCEFVYLRSGPVATAVIQLNRMNFGYLNGYNLKDKGSFSVSFCKS